MHFSMLLGFFAFQASRVLKQACTRFICLPTQSRIAEFYQSLSLAVKYLLILLALFDRLFEIRWNRSVNICIAADVSDCFLFFFSRSDLLKPEMQDCC